ncbi:non-ribosomal peptide synthetase [Pseudoalteromonas luteoviolacea]|uniref:Carrier domain-containing protein n=1 Tax=Pseudoalteromonas luteoviolacea S4054 TaxID=1129367 RepID=A0A0F6AC50_9GAMM|nr:non-ribosomal peptide synthetase [Pseudoalteromonas luteoviolacea]AOT10639.1 hypothetical protein S4054249_22525 [Pseudoalteromonas luteoviolacea]AOT15293.1 hypothetical protein S40542_21070 [Pseudoalteromonas luteoviolacea]AOT20458.1 hypothetical protein S4054_22440 [Pseudoalteromonas luteoviolacea]KKE83738.1 hypothetical protein N479_12995 [Pseudoalteromonas luteoviolacea S4054]KZN71942.1 hypothetical protein N481_17360 [Pseudoalteromonas luteoviolacea S4047-1]
MSPLSILNTLRKQGIQLSYADDSLKIKAPKGAMTAEIQALLKENKLALVEFFQQQQVSQNQRHLKEVAAIDRDQRLPLSFFQQALWFIDQLSDQGSHYNVPITIEIKGELNIDALQQSLQALVMRHEILRTCYLSDDEGAYQQIMPQADLELKYQDLRELQADAQQQRCQSIRQEVTQQPFDLTQDLMIRGQLVQTEEQVYQLFICIHHIAADGGSLAVLTFELSALYQAFSQGKTAELAPQPIQYADYASWQLDWFEQEGPELLSFWQEKLKNIPVLHSIGTDYPRPIRQTFAGDTVSSHFSEQTVAGLEAIARDQNATLFMVLQAAFATLLHRYSGESDIVMGTPVENREHSGLSSLVGLFANSVVLRNDFSSDISFNEIVRQAKQYLLQAFRHQAMPLEVLVEHLQPERSLSHSPLFQVMLVLQNNQGGALSLPGLTLNSFYQENSSAKFDLTLNIQEDGKALRLNWEYNSDIFSRQRIAHLSQLFDRLVAEVIADSDVQIADICLLNQTEKNLLLGDWSYRTAETPVEQSLHGLFEQQAQLTPDAVAIRFQQTVMSYRELDLRANQLARVLRKHGVERNQLVGLCLPRGVDLYVGLLAILKAGAAYVPLDASFPAEVVAKRLSVIKPNIVLCDQITASLIAEEQQQLNITNVDWSDVDASQLNLPFSSQDLAYVLTTSGSTGEPKAIAMNHAPLTNLIAAVKLDCPTLAQPARVLQFASIGFDISFTDIFLAWLSGGELIAIEQHQQHDVVSLSQLIVEQRISVLHLPYSMLQAFAHHTISSEQKLDDVNVIISTAEQLKITDDIRELFNHWTKAELLNYFGPSETQVVTSHQLTGDADTWPEIPAIGKPITNVSCYVLDEKLQPVPVGVVGELYCGGAGVAQGYLYNPELTEQKFIADPFSESDGQRLYRTGDLVRWTQDGALEYFGRGDQQVKLRGFRVELGEIETALIQQAGVSDAVVILEPEQQILIGYVVIDGSVVTSLTQLKQQLTQLLPSYMIPAGLVAMDKLPLTSNGKVDKKALPAVDLSQLEKVEYVEPVSETEKVLASVWQQLLSVTQVGRNDNFFDIGGHSLLATKLVNHIREKLQVEVSIGNIFEHQTLFALAEFIDNSEGCDDLVLSLTNDNEQPVLSYSQQRFWLAAQMEPNSTQYNMFGAYHMRGDLDIEKLTQAFNIVIERHPILTTVYTTTASGECQPELKQFAPFTLKQFDLSLVSAAERQSQLEQLITLEQDQPFDLTKDMMVRAGLAKMSEQHWVLILTIHHIAFDGWSFAILNRDLAEVYNALTEQREPKLPPLLTSYNNYARWQRNWLEQGRSERLLDFWRDALDGIPECLSLPTDYTRSTEPDFRGKRFRYQLDLSSSQAVQRLALNKNVTLYMVLHSALSYLLKCYSDSDDIVVGSPIANRERHEIENVVGVFINMLAMRLKFSADISFNDLLKQSKEYSLAAYQHQQLPFDALVDELAPERHSNFSPIYQVMLALQNNDAADVQLNGCVFNELESDHLIVKNDLCLNVLESSDGLVFEWDYPVALFKQSTIERMNSQLVRLLQSVTEQPDRQLSAADMLADDELELISKQWNVTQYIKYDYEHLHQVFENQAQSFPQALAVSCANEQLTYEQLNQKANQLARALSAEGVSQGDHIGCFMERSNEAVTTIWALMKLGAVYVPIDPVNPKERVEYIIQDANIELLLSLSRHEERLPECGGVILVDKYPELSEFDDHNLPTLADSNLVAYIIYTSGSTGKPKGVMATHSNVISLCMEANKLLKFKPGTQGAALGSLSFDLSIAEILMPLCHGASVRLVHPDEVMDMELFGQSLKDCTLLHAVPSLMSEVLYYKDQLDDSEQFLPKLQILATGGEQVSRDLLIRMHASFPEAEKFEIYGPTECSVFSTMRKVTDFETAHNKSIIGHPIKHVKTVVMDQAGNLLPVNVPGELCISGPGVTAGYLNRPELTAEKYATTDIEWLGERVYRTGDLVRWLEDGSFEFLGRIDTQVKIRGFRVELAEIETAFKQLPVVKEALVSYWRSPDCLVAYVVCEESLTAQQLFDEFYQTAGGALPKYMIPDSIELMESLPTNSNGKFDRKQLVRPAELMVKQAHYQAPSSQLEQALCDLWQQLLNREQIGVLDNFFELGGHSLLATRLATLASHEFSVELSVKNIFAHQTIQSLAEYIEHQGKSNLGRIEKAPVGLKDNLSFAQQRLWLIDQIQVDNSQYNMPSVLRLKGQLDVEALSTSLLTIVERHQVLRTGYRRNSLGEAEIFLHPVPNSVIECIDLTHLPLAEREIELERHSKQSCQSPFNLTDDLMLRACLIQLTEDEYVLLVTMHHIASDGWSQGVMVKELAQLYAAYSEQKPNPLPELPIQYYDYAHWQNTWLSGDRLEGQIDYWRQRLDGIPTVHNLPLDFARNKAVGGASAYYQHQLSPSLLAGLTKLAAANDATLFMLLNSVFACLLSRHSGETDIVVGTAVANRDQVEVSDLVGFFVNTLVLRTELHDDPSFHDLLARSREDLLNAYQNQQVSFDHLVEELNPKRSLNHSPLFQVMLVLQNNEEISLDLADLQLSLASENIANAKYDITLSVNEGSDGLTLYWEFAADLFTETTIARMSGHFERLLEAVVNDPSCQVSKLPMITETEQELIVNDWNNTQVDYPADQGLHQPFEQQAALTPDAVAVVFEQQSLTYAELNRRANQLAAVLREHGVSHAEPIGLCVERSLEMVIGLLGILKANAAYVPLDPNYPLERKQRIVAKAGIALVVADQKNSTDFQRVVAVDSSPTEKADLDFNHAFTATAYDTAYVIFTSGSTGEPKGVEIAHHSAVNLITLVNRNFNIDAEDTVLCITSVGFDLSVYDIFGALAAGAKLVVSKSGDELEPKRLLNLIDQHQVTYWDSVPSTLKMIVDYIDLTQMDFSNNSLRLAFLSGDWIPTTLPQQAKSHFDRLQVISLGGATEGTVWSNFYPITEDMSQRKSVPYGRPLDNNTFYILDKHLQPVPLGVAGELYIGGVGVAKSYYQDPEKTAQSYLPNPFHADRHPTMYKTGDMGRLMADEHGMPGQMEFLGRIDHQVKIRGFRVELGEIEHCLRQHELVKDVLIMVTDEPQYIVAYLVTSNEHEFDESQLNQVIKAHLVENLPDYMVPAVLMFLPVLPLTANGKLDRKALPKPDLASVSTSDYIAPEGEVELQLAEIWQELLQVNKVSVTDNFFDIGGNSLLATRLVASIYRQFDVEIEIASLFHNQSIRQQALLLQSFLSTQDVLDNLDDLSEAEIDALMAQMEE